MNMKTLAITNQKGGVGKTTTVVTLGHALARRGKTVLLIDLDPQGQAATCLGLTPEPGVFNLFIGQGDPRDWVRGTGRENLHLLPGDRSTATAQIVLNAESRPITAAAEVIRRFADEYDYLIFDTAPSAGGLQERAIWASNSVIIPAATEFLSADGVSQMVQLLSGLSKRGWPGTLLGVLPTFHDSVTRHSQVAMQRLDEAFGNRLLSPIRRATILRDCSAGGQTIWERDQDCPVALDYARLTDVVLKN